MTKNIDTSLEGVRGQAVACALLATAIFALWCSVAWGKPTITQEKFIES